MPAPKGSYNARCYHEEAANKVEAALRQALAIPRSGMVFRNVSALAVHVAPACGRTDGQLRRNPRYRAILEDYVARQPGAVALMGEDTQSASILRAKLLEVTVRAANLERDKKRLAAFIAKRPPDRTPPAQHPTGSKPTGDRDPDHRRAFECTAAALDAIIQHAELYEVDPKSGALFDRSARPGSPPVVGSHLLEDFIRWRKLKNTKNQ
jgi:hypothetical protein